MDLDEIVQEDVSDWELVMRFLPEGWREKARGAGALRRRGRKFRSSEALLRTLLVHLGGGCSLKETAVRARLGELAEV
jgi:hypothetical protein